MPDTDLGTEETASGCGRGDLASVCLG